MNTPAAELASALGSTAAGQVLVIDDDVMIRELVRAALEAEGLSVTTAENGVEALALLERALPDLIICDVNMPEMDGFTLLETLRARTAGRAVPWVFLTSRGEADDAVRGLRLGADDYLRKPFDLSELLARVHVKLARPPVPLAERPRDGRPLLLPKAPGSGGRGRARAPTERNGRSAVLAVLDVDERANLIARFGPRADVELARQIAPLVEELAGEVDIIGRDSTGQFLLLLPERGGDELVPLLHEAAQRIVHSKLHLSGERVSVTPIIGWTIVDGDTMSLSPEQLVARAAMAAEASRSQLDLQPVKWTIELERAVLQVPPGRIAALYARWRTPLQFVGTLLLGTVVPFFGYVAFAALGHDISTPAYLVVVVALLFTALVIWVEGLLALDPIRPVAQAQAPPPRASAIIAAYLPNEAATIIETVESFLRVDYPDLEIVLAYNTVRPMAVQAELAEIARRDPRFIALDVAGSTSKAQNVNSALAHVTGEFVGVFDADHHPDPGSFRRAWRWLSSGYDVVQGHCVIRNGDASWVARTIAVEFEAIYAVSHPGRSRLHGFGVFGGSNGYWRTSLLRNTRMHGFMLTEDIDSSLRVIEAGGRIANDPALISRELAPTTVGALWNQRMRWAQGWFQVSRKHLVRGWRSPHLSLRQKLGLTFLLGWREVYPWVSLQAFPVVAFLAYKAGGLTRLNWAIPLFVLATLITLSVGPGQVFFAYRLAVPELRARKKWFLAYLALASVAYSEWKNVIGRISQIKELCGERTWKVTPRSADAAATSPDLPVGS